MDKFFTLGKYYFLLLFLCLGVISSAQRPICPEGFYETENLHEFEREVLENLEKQLLEKAGKIQGRTEKVYTIPVFVTVLHDADENDGASTPDYATIVRGVDLMNQAFRNEGPFAGDPKI